ncbi:MAG TPA: GAF domain-containing sensor histidine kinase [Bacteroidota bacterium]|jgi:signal transduction histidine kinase|nr:GAF domain-containing sensor histidine kinase [Bacteroidota bacterium]
MKLIELLTQQQISGGESGPRQVRHAGPDRSEGGRAVQDLETVLSVVRKINTSLVLSDVLALVIDHAIRITHADRGFLMLADRDGRLQYVIGHDKNENVIHPENFQVSQSVLEDVYRTGESICIEGALTDKRFEQRQSIINLELQTIMCAPLQTHESTIGVIYVDSRFIQGVQKDEILRLFEILAGQAALAIRNAKLYENLKSTYEELKEANEHIIKSERMALRGEMAAEVSHELRNLLNIALLQSQELQRRMKRGEIDLSTRLVKDVIDSVRKIGDFSENLLTRSSVTSEMNPLSLNSLVSTFVSFINVLPKFRKGKVVMELDDELPDIGADPDQLQQVLLNLANNAIEARPDATLTFKTEYDFIHNNACLVVSDNGPGLDPRVKEKLFVQNITTKPNGHGFGLPVCRKIIQNHKGEITVESLPNQGTRFILRFPLPS